MICCIHPFRREIGWVAATARNQSNGSQITPILHNLTFNTKPSHFVAHFNSSTKTRL